MKTRFIDLSAYVNAHAATFDADRSAGFVNAWRNSFPAEEVPFGCDLVVGGYAFRLPQKAPGGADHVEALGQEISLNAPITTAALAVLGFGELGNQLLSMTLANEFGECRQMEVVLPNWLAPKAAVADAHGWRASHLHYASGYDLDHLCPMLFAVSACLATPFQLASITLLPNPLAHVIAISLVPKEANYV